jgi:hypothetical protein
MLAVLACVVCAGGYTEPAHAQAAPDECLAAAPQGDPDADRGAPANGGDFAEHDDDDDDFDQEPNALLSAPLLSPALWERDSAPALWPSSPVGPGYLALEPRPPR